MNYNLKCLCTFLTTFLLSLVTSLGAGASPARADVQPGDFHAYPPGVIKVYAPGINEAGWRVTKAIRTWSRVMPEGYSIKGVSTPCRGCMVVSLVDHFDPEFYGPHTVGVAGFEPDVDWWDGNSLPVPWRCRIDLTTKDNRLHPRYKRFVMAHEMGHCLGLDHRPFAQGSIMAEDNTPAGVYGPTTQDVADLHEVYATQPVSWVGVN